MMLNFSPVDRPSFDVVLSSLISVYQKQYYLLETAKIFIESTYLSMKHEVEYEYFAKETENLVKDNENNSSQLMTEQTMVKEEEEDFDSIFLRLSSIYDPEFIRMISSKLNFVLKSDIEFMIAKIKLSPVLTLNNPKDRFKMVHDMTKADLMPSSVEYLDAKSILQLGVFDYFNNDLLDLEFIAQELVLKSFKFNCRSRFGVKIVNDHLVFSDHANRFVYQSINSPEIYLIDLFLIFVRKELLKFQVENNLDEDDIFFGTSEFKADQEFETELLHEKLIDDESFWEKLIKIDPGYLMIMICAQVMVFIFSFLFIVRQHNLNKYKKNTFNSYVVF
jgi:hypothetical protein